MLSQSCDSGYSKLFITYILWELKEKKNKKQYNTTTVEISVAISQKNYGMHQLQPPRHTPKELSQRYLHIHTYAMSIHSSKNTELAQMSINSLLSIHNG